MGIRLRADHKAENRGQRVRRLLRRDPEPGGKAEQGVQGEEPGDHEKPGPAFAETGDGQQGNQPHGNDAELVHEQSPLGSDWPNGLKTV